MKSATSGIFYGRNGVIRHPTYSIFSDSACISFDSPAIFLFNCSSVCFLKHRFFCPVFLGYAHAQHHRSISLPQASSLLKGRTISAAF